MSDHESISTRWSELYRLLLEPDTIAYALAPTDRANDPVKVNSGDAASLIAEAERAGAGRAIWAVVAPLRPDLLVLDIDECADEVWPTLRDVAADVGAGVAHCATSGRPNCLHVALAIPTPQARDHLIATIADLDRHHRPYLPDDATIDVRGRKPIRLPGSVSLKGYGHCNVVDEYTLAPITAVAAVRRAVDALKDLPTQRPVEPAQSEPLTHAFIAPPDETLVSDNSGMQWESPRAWRARRPMTPQDWRTLTAVDTSDRSLAATQGAWCLWNYGIRSFAAARWWYERMPCFRKFRERDLAAHRKSGGQGSMRWEACRRHWNSIVSRTRTHKPAIPSAEQAVIDAALEEVSWWPTADLADAAAALIHHRFADGHGISARPVARRDLCMLLHVSDGTASRLIERLVAQGLLQLVERWPAANPRHANLFTLTIPPRIYRGKVAHDVTSPRARTTLPHPLWGKEGHTHRRVWHLLHPDSALTTAELATSAGLPPGDHTHGLLRILHSLSALGLARRIGRGRGTRWSLGEVSLDEAAAASGAMDRARQISARVVAERRCWHSETRSEQARSRRGLEVLRKRLTHVDALPGMAHTFARSRTMSPSWRRSTEVALRRDGPG